MKMITTKAAAKVAAVATGLAMATSMLSLAPIAHAQTATTCSFTASLTVGSTGAAVSCLQQALIAAGFSIPAGATGYFGAQTRAAVASWQSSRNITPAVGYFGPISRAAWNLGGGSTGGTSTVAGCAAGDAFSRTTGQACTTTTSTVPGCAPGAAFSSTTGQACGTTTATGPLTGSGRLTGESQAGDVTTTLYEGDASTAIIGDEFTATGGDVALQRVDATFDLSAITGGSSPSTNLDQYVDDVSVWLGSTKLASMDASNGDKNSNVWTYRFSGLNAVIKSGTTGHIYVKVTPVSGIGSGEDGAVLTAKLLADSVRAISGDGISDTYVATALTQTFSVNSANSGTLTVTAAGDNPTAGQVSVSSSTTTGVKLLSFNMKAKNTDVIITDLKAQFNTSDNNLNDVVNTVYLMKGSTVLKSATLSTGTTGFVTFTNVNQTISKDSTVNYTITADLKGDAAYADGVTLVASTTVAGWDVSDANGSSVTPSAAAVGNTQTLTATGITVTRGTPTATVTAGLTTAGDIASFTIPFTVTAGDNDVYIGGATVKGSTNTAGKVAFATTTTSTQGATGEPTSNLSVADTVTGDSAGVYYKVLAGTSRTFTLNATVIATTTGATTAGYVGMIINSIAYGTVAGTETSYYTSNLSTFKTNDVYVTKR